MRRRILVTALAAVALAAGVVQQPAGAGNSGVLFGALVAPKNETFQQAITRQDTAYGIMPISRVFYSGAVQQWPGNAGVSGRPVVVSFKYAPKDVLAGTYDTALSGFFAGAPSTYDVYWSYIHEPEDNIERGEFTAVAYRAAWQRISHLADVAAPGNAHLHSTLILMCFTMNAASGRNWHNYYVDRTVASMIAFDCYNHAGKQNKYGDPANIFGPVTAWSTANPGIPWGISEVGSTLGNTDAAGTKRAAWLRSVGTFLANRHSANPEIAALFGIYFDTVGPSLTDYRLTDPASRNAWSDVVQHF